MAAKPIRLAAGILLLASAACALPPDGDPEDSLKAVVVLNFLRYSTWPETSGPLTIGVMGRSPVVPPFRQLLEGKSVGGRVIHVVEIKGIPDPHCCQVLYIATDNAARIRQAVGVTPAAHVLTIGESDRFLENGGAVSLMLIDGHIGFEVSLEALEAAGIQVSSRLLRLGQVRGRTSG